MKTNPSLIPIISTIPIVGYVIVFSFALIAMLQLGHWPYYAHPDPKELNLPFFYEIASIALLITLLSFALIPVTIAISIFLKWGKRGSENKKILVKSFLFYVFGLSIWVIDGKILGLGNWILD